MEVVVSWESPGSPPAGTLWVLCPLHLDLPPEGPAVCIPQCTVVKHPSKVLWVGPVG